jgi:branched-subunit amino acid aminotransferase/4-amino-4-deoxychorismate lyase
MGRIVEIGDTIIIYDESSIKNLLLNHPGCIYTTMYVCGEKLRVTDLSSHVDRLSQVAVSSSEEDTLSRIDDGTQRDIVRSKIRLRIQEAIPRGKDCFGEVAGLMVVVVILQQPHDGEDSEDWMKIYMSAYDASHAVRHGGTAYILGPPRKNPMMKDTTWVADRRYLEEMAPTDAIDVLLCTEEGNVLEGLITNLFIVVEKESGDMVVQTAPVEAGVLPGTMRARVIEACKHAGIPIEYSVCPNVSERHLWREAFLTNRYDISIYYNMCRVYFTYHGKKRQAIKRIFFLENAA